MGVPTADVPKVAELLGTKLVLNEFVAYTVLTDKYRDMDPKAFSLSVFALTGFANFSSIGIQLGGIGALAPERRSDLARLGPRALLGGFLATLVNAAVAGLLL
jgi:CNT family concentrative nucleoside transporter